MDGRSLTRRPCSVCFCFLFTVYGDWKQVPLRGYHSCTLPRSYPVDLVTSQPPHPQCRRSNCDPMPLNDNRGIRHHALPTRQTTRASTVIHPVFGRDSRSLLLVTAHKNVRLDIYRRTHSLSNNACAARRPVLSAPPTPADSSSSNASPAKNNVPSTGRANSLRAGPPFTPA